MWIRNVPSNSTTRAPHLFPTPGRGGVFPPSSAPEGACVSGPAPPRHVHGVLTTCRLGHQVSYASVVFRMRARMLLCARALRPPAHLAAALRNKCASIGQRVPDGGYEWGPTCPRPGPPLVAHHRDPFAGPGSSAPEGAECGSFYLFLFTFYLLPFAVVT